MPSETTVWLSVILVFAAVVAKIATANFLAAQRKQLADLQTELRKIQEKLQTLLEQARSAKDNLLFYQRREVEVTSKLEKLGPELERFMDAERKHLEALGYDPDQEGLDIDEILKNTPQEAVDASGAPDPSESEALPESEEIPESSAVDLSLPICVVPAALGNADRLFLPDAVITDLLGVGVSVMERAVLNRMAEEKGDDLAQIIEREEFFKLGYLSNVRAIVVINSKMRGSGIATATCKIVEIPTGKIILSKSYEQPGIDERSPDFEPLTETSRILCESISATIGIPAQQTDP